MRGERSGRRGDLASKAVNAGTDPAQQEAPPTLEALKNLIGVVARSGAPQLPWRVTGAILPVSYTHLTLPTTPYV